MRVKSELWVKAHLRRLAGDGIFAVVARRGATEAGAIYVKLSRLDGTAIVFAPAPTGFAVVAEERQWIPYFDTGYVEETKVDDFLRQQSSFDPDIWVIELEDRDGRHRMEDWLAAS